MIRGLYSLAMLGAQPLLRRKLARRGAAEPGYLEAVDERFGRYDAAAAPGALWIHAVSLGETRAAGILIGALRRLEPGLRILLTHGTATGRAEGRRLLQPGDTQVWLPWDTPAAVGRFLDHFQPAMGVLMETELWPNLLAGCRQRGVRVVMANARLNQASLRGALRLRLLSRPAYASLAAVWAQTQGDAQRLRQAGARVDAVLGNLKFDATPPEPQGLQGRAWRAGLGRPVVMFASSREGEEQPFLEAVCAARADGPGAGVQWLLVPRHPQRFDEVEALVRQAGLSVSRRSQWADAPAPADLWLGDSLGEMALYYGMSDAALLGGSFAPLGGQNLIEASACGCPVVMGPHTFNFAEAAQWAEEAGAALRVEGMRAGVGAALSLVLDPPRQHQLARSATDFAAAHRGAAERTAQALVKMLDAPGRPPA